MLCIEFPLWPQQRAGEGCRRGQATDAGSQAPLPGPSAGRRPSNLAQLAEDDLWTLTTWASWVRRTAARVRAMGTRTLVFCLFMPGWTLSWFRHDFWRTMKEPWRIYEGMRLQLPINLFLENHSMGSDQAWSAWVYMNSSQWNFNWAGVKTFNSVLWSFVLLTFWRVCILYASLFQRARGICLMKKLSIPNWGGHWSYVCAWMCVCVCLSAWECASGSGSSCTLWFFWCPIVKSTNAATWTHFVIPLLTTEFAVYLDNKNGKSRILDVNMPQRPNPLEFQLKV